MLDWEYPLMAYTMRHVSDNISQAKFYTKNQIIVFVFVLASVLLCLFPATVVIQNFFDEFILEFIWLVICIYALRKIPDLLGIVVLQHD